MTSHEHAGEHIEPIEPSKEHDEDPIPPELLEWAIRAKDAFLASECDADTARATLRRQCHQVERAVESLFEDLTGLCEQAQATGFREASIQLAFPDTNSLEAVAGAGDTPPFFHNLRRGMPKDPALHDIVVDAMKRRQAERILRGRKDERYDSYLWDLEGHSRFQDRLFVPLLLPRDKSGALCPDQCEWVREPHDEFREVWVPKVTARVAEIEAIGTLSLSNTKILEPAAIEQSLRLSTTIAEQVYGTTLQGVIDRMLRTLREASHARSATIHFVPAGNALGYFSLDIEGRRDIPHLCYVARHNARAQEKGGRQAGLIGGPPRPNGIGVRVLKDGHPRHLSRGELKDLNPGLWADGVRSLSVYPLRSSSGEYVGLLYLHQCENDEQLMKGWDVEFLVDRVGHALSQVAQAVRQRRKAKERAAINHMMEVFLAKPRFTTLDELSKAFAGTLASFLGADAVAIHRRGLPIVKAGRFESDDGACKVWPASPVFVHERNVTGLCRRAWLPLKVGDDALGTVFIGYGYGESFADKELIETLVSLGALSLHLFRTPAYDPERQHAIAQFRQKRAQAALSARNESPGSISVLPTAKG